MLKLHILNIFSSSVTVSFLTLLHSIVLILFIHKHKLLPNSIFLSRKPISHILPLLLLPSLLPNPSQLLRPPCTSPHSSVDSPQTALASSGGLYCLHGCAVNIWSPLHCTAAWALLWEHSTMFSTNLVAPLYWTTCGLKLSEKHLCFYCLILQSKCKMRPQGVFAILCGSTLYTRGYNSTQKYCMSAQQVLRWHFVRYDQNLKKEETTALK